ncbi:ABC transporter ATP-binding protein [Segnochrobactrum spirostomi]|uniref:sn-glycerol-3-phosphate ABC transporter ATP-binding protein UgpC n=1 Tax=Segnochrobactrum spirostomi TaxID=2608987 RepID=A0A6A7Y9E8_9HYPH|nr:sn-glycerol-3-phosphate ABC transporter ATP-binding protein UgpC [Segnochrobactrum spirostomi]MQT15506.1 sn-glycerol-3-phosphate ABC transporter ATP-binding protein UgpC [Segnochrobactrum spirostomi]
MAPVSLQSVTKSYGGHSVIHGIDLEIEDGAFVVLVGPSGCGKSTLLRMIAGLETITSGTISIDGQTVNDVPPKHRDIAMVFQNYALYPHMTVAENMGFSLRLAKVSAGEAAEKVRTSAAILGLTDLLDRYPRQLSGGQRQRVAMGRAMVRNPKVFLFDEPLSNLDAALRVQMRVEIAELHQRLGTTMIYVTHDQTEAMTLATKIAVIDKGRLVQAAGAIDLYERPDDLFVARFIGSPQMNVLPGRIETVRDGAYTVAVGGDARIAFQGPPPLGTGATVSVGLRPEALTCAADGPIKGRVTLIEHLGGSSLVHIAGPGGNPVVVQDVGAPRLKVGEEIRLRAAPAGTHLFDGSGRRVASGALA